jgi:ABC-type sugar transport system permease subunit
MLINKVMRMNKLYGNKLAIFIFAFPALLLFTVFVIYPIFPEVLISFQKNDGFRNMGYVGLKNYIDVLKNDTFRCHHCRRHLF